jgi:hypothetical protein
MSFGCVLDQLALLQKSFMEEVEQHVITPLANVLQNDFRDMVARKKQFTAADKKHSLATTK